MPSKFIPDDVWERSEAILVEAVVETKQSFKDADILRLLIELGIEKVTKEDYRNFADKKKKK